MATSNLIRVEGYNLLIHYHKDESKNLIHLLTEGLLDKLKDGSQKQKFRASISCCKEVSVVKISNKKFVTGYFHKSTRLDWDHIEANEEPVKKRGHQRVMPRARFYIDVENHNIYWITKAGITGNPSISNFLAFLKQTSTDILVRNYSKEFNKNHKPHIKSKDAKKVKRALLEFLKDNKVTSAEFKIELVPLIPAQMLKKFFTPKYKIMEILLRPKKSNPKKKDFDNLLEKAEDTFSDADADVEIKAKASNSKKGMNQKKLEDAVSKTLEEGTLLLKMKVQEKNEEEKGDFIVSNMKISKKQAAGQMDISLKKQYNTKFDKEDLSNIIKDVSKNTTKKIQNLATGTMKKLLEKII